MQVATAATADSSATPTGDSVNRARDGNNGLRTNQVGSVQTESRSSPRVSYDLTKYAGLRLGGALDDHNQSRVQTALGTPPPCWRHRPIRMSCTFFSPSVTETLIGELAASAARNAGSFHWPFSTSVTALIR